MILKRSNRVTLTLMSLVVALGLVHGAPLNGASAEADDVDAPTAGGSSSEPDAYEAAAMSYLNEVGGTPERAEAAIRDQEALSILLAERDIDPSADAEIWVESLPESQIIHVRTTNASIIETLSTHPFEVSEVAVEQPASGHRALAIDHDALEAAIRDVSPGVQGFYIEVGSGALVIDTVDALADADLVALRTATGFDEIEVNEMAEAAADTLTVRGGAATSTCTSGFAATRGNLNGFFTAAHCRSSAQSLFAGRNNSGASTPATLDRYVNNANGDIAFYRVAAGNPLSRVMYASNTTTHTVTSIGTAVTGNQACSRGKTSGWRCATIAAITYRPTWSNACPGTTCNAVFVRLNTNIAGGDSGGPLVMASAAIGIAKGGGVSIAVFSRIGYRPSGTSVYVS